MGHSKPIGTIVIVGFPYTPDSNTGRGIDRYTNDLVLGLVDKGYTVRVVSEGKVSGPSWNFILSLCRSLYKIFKFKSDNSIFHAVDPLGALLLIIAKKEPVVVTVHDMLPHLLKTTSLRRSMTKVIVNYVIRHSDFIITTFEFTKRILQQKFPQSETKASVVHLGFQNMSGSDSNFCNHAHSSNEFTLLHIGAFDHGSEDAVRIFSELAKENPRVKLILGGTGSTDPRIKHLIDKLGLTERIELTGFIPERDMGSLFHKASVFIYPSNLGFSYLVLQSMLLGIPVVAYDIWDMKEYAADSVLLCPYRNHLMFARMIDSILSDNGQRKRLVYRAKQRASGFTINDMIEGTLEVYGKVVMSQQKEFE